MTDGPVLVGPMPAGRWSLALAFTTGTAQRTRLVAHHGTPTVAPSWAFGLAGASPFVEMRDGATATLRGPRLVPGLHVAIVHGEASTVASLTLDGVRYASRESTAVLADDLGPFPAHDGLTLGGVRDVAGGHADLRFGLDDGEDLLHAVLRNGWTVLDHAELSRATALSDGSHGRPDATELAQPFAPGEGGYAGFRIPGLLRLPSGMLLAACEGRVESVSDSCATKDLVVKRSADGGRTWSALHVAVDGRATFGGTTGSAMNPSLIRDAVHGSGRTLLAFTALDANEWDVQAARARSRLMIAESLDDGRSWGPPRPLVEPDAVPPDLPLAFPDLADRAPAMRVPSLGHGVQLTRGPGRGRMLLCGNATYGTQSVFDSVLHLLVSDDAGRSWRFGPTPARWHDGRPANGLNEVGLAETAEGGVIASVRAYRDGRPTGRRAVCEAWTDDDAGLHWRPARDATELPAPAVHGSATSWTSPDGGHRLALCHPHHPTERRSLSVRTRRPHGRWSRPLVVRDGFSAYSDVAYDPRGDALIVAFERSLDGAVAIARLDAVSETAPEPEDR